MQEGIEDVGPVQEETAVEEVQAPVEVEQAPQTEAPAAPEPEKIDGVEVGDKKESVRDTVKRVLEAQKNKADSAGGDNKPDGEAPLEEKPAQAEQVKKTKPKFDPEDPELKAPDRLEVHEKEMFRNLPAGLKRGFNRSLKNLQAMATRATQEYAAKTKEIGGVLEAAQPFAHMMAEQGLTLPQATAMLYSAHAKLSNPATREAAFLKLADDLGMDFEQLAARKRGEVPTGRSAPVDIESHPAFRSIQSQLQSVISERDQKVAHERSQLASSIVTEMEAVRDEWDAQAGRYRFPELHDASFIERTKPLVVELVRTVPGLSHGEALRRAYTSLTGKPAGASTQPPQTKFPASSNSQIQNRAASAGVSVRGRLTPTVASQGLEGLSSKEIPNDVRSTVRMVLENARRGNAI
jgi:hypothetical protein